MAEGDSQKFEAYLRGIETGSDGPLYECINLFEAYLRGIETTKSQYFWYNIF